MIQTGKKEDSLWDSELEWDSDTSTPDFKHGRHQETEQGATGCEQDLEWQAIREIQEKGGGHPTQLEDHLGKEAHCSCAHRLSTQIMA